ncbi:hypothetical protein RUND412_009992 [Rhizina undulata]
MNLASNGYQYKIGIARQEYILNHNDEYETMLEQLKDNYESPNSEVDLTSMSPINSKRATPAAFKSTIELSSQENPYSLTDNSMAERSFRNNMFFKRWDGGTKEYAGKEAGVPELNSREAREMNPEGEDTDCAFTFTRMLNSSNTSPYFVDSQGYRQTQIQTLSVPPVTKEAKPVQTANSKQQPLKSKFGQTLKRTAEVLDEAANQEHENEFDKTVHICKMHTAQKNANRVLRRDPKDVDLIKGPGTSQ